MVLWAEYLKSFLYVIVLFLFFLLFPVEWLEIKISLFGDKRKKISLFGDKGKFLDLYLSGLPQETDGNQNSII